MRIRLLSFYILMFVTAFITSGSVQGAFKEIPLPAQLSESSILNNPIESYYQIRDQLNNFNRLSFMESDSSDRDLIIFLLDIEGIKILPDLESMSTAADFNTITFTYDSPEQPWTQSELDSLQQYISEVYPLIVDIYGYPAFNIGVNIIKDTTIDYAGIYFPSMNQMVLDGLSVGTLCHEMVHAFRDDVVIYFDAYEEGMAEAVEWLVGNQLEQYSFGNYSSWYSVYYEGLNKPHVSSRNGNFWYFDVGSFVSMKYKMGSTIWRKLQIERDDFLEFFNGLYYRKVKDNFNFNSEEDSIKDLLREMIDNIEEQPFDSWYDSQHILNFKPEFNIGMFIDNSLFRLYMFSIDTSDGSQDPLPLIPFKCEIFNYNDSLVYLEEDVTSSSGYYNLAKNVGDHNFNLPDDYFGRIKVKITAQFEEKEIVDSSYRIYYDNLLDETEGGVFGVVIGENNGYVTVTPHVRGEPVLTGSVVNGAFLFNRYHDVVGKFTVTYTRPDSIEYIRDINKAGNDCYIEINSLGGITSVDAESEMRPFSYTLNQNYPNPFNPSTTISFTLPRESRINLSVYNILGQKVRTFIDYTMEAGFHEVTWDGLDQSGNLMASGIYYCRLKTDDNTASVKMLLLR